MKNAIQKIKAYLENQEDRKKLLLVTVIVAVIGTVLIVAVGAYIFQQSNVKKDSFTAIRANANVARFPVSLPYDVLYIEQGTLFFSEEGQYQGDYFDYDDGAIVDFVLSADKSTVALAISEPNWVSKIQGFDTSPAEYDYVNDALESFNYVTQIGILDLISGELDIVYEVPEIIYTGYYTELIYSYPSSYPSYPASSPSSYPSYPTSMPFSYYGPVPIKNSTFFGDGRPNYLYYHNTKLLDFEHDANTILLASENKAFTLDTITGATEGIHATGKTHALDFWSGCTPYGGTIRGNAIKVTSGCYETSITQLFLKSPQAVQEVFIDLDLVGGLGNISDTILFNEEYLITFEHRWDSNGYLPKVGFYIYNSSTQNLIQHISLEELTPFQVPVSSAATWDNTPRVWSEPLGFDNEGNPLVRITSSIRGGRSVEERVDYIARINLTDLSIERLYTLQDDTRRTTPVAADIENNRIVISRTGIPISYLSMSYPISFPKDENGRWPGMFSTFETYNLESGSTKIVAVTGDGRLQIAFL